MVTLLSKEMCPLCLSAENWRLAEKHYLENKVLCAEVEQLRAALKVAGNRLERLGHVVGHDEVQRTLAGKEGK